MSKSLLHIVAYHLCTRPYRLVAVKMIWARLWLAIIPCSKYASHTCLRMLRVSYLGQFVTIWLHRQHRCYGKYGERRSTYYNMCAPPYHFLRGFFFSRCSLKIINRLYLDLVRGWLTCMSSQTSPPPRSLNRPKADNVFTAVK